MLKLVSVAPLLFVVFKVLTLMFGSLNTEILFSGFCNFVLFLVITPAVVTSLPPTLAVNSNSVSETMYLTILVTVPPALFVNVIESLIFRSELNVVPFPKIVASLFATVMFPAKAVLLPYVESTLTSAV